MTYSHKRQKNESNSKVDKYRNFPLKYSTQDHIYSIGERYPILQASELIQLMFHCYETRDKIKTSCLPFQFYVSVYWYLITTLGQVQHTGL